MRLNLLNNYYIKDLFDKHKGRPQHLLLNFKFIVQSVELQNKDEVKPTFWTLCDDISELLYIIPMLFGKQNFFNKLYLSRKLVCILIVYRIRLHYSFYFFLIFWVFLCYHHYLLNTPSSHQRNFMKFVEGMSQDILHSDNLFFGNFIVLRECSCWWQGDMSLKTTSRIASLFSTEVIKITPG